MENTIILIIIVCYAEGNHIDGAGAASGGLRQDRRAGELQRPCQDLRPSPYRSRQTGLLVRFFEGVGGAVALICCSEGKVELCGHALDGCARIIKDAAVFVYGCATAGESVGGLLVHSFFLSIEFPVIRSTFGCETCSGKSVGYGIGQIEMGVFVISQIDLIENESMLDRFTGSVEH